MKCWRSLFADSSTGTKSPDVDNGFSAELFLRINRFCCRVLKNSFKLCLLLPFKGEKVELRKMRTKKGSEEIDKEEQQEGEEEKEVASSPMRITRFTKFRSAVICYL